jgi:cell fate regulator YaaT (PSP1 superfamily)
MCCLMYEHRTYVEARRRFPREGKILRTAKGEEKVVTVDIWRDTVTLRDIEGARRTVTLEALKEEVSGSPLGGEARGAEGGADAGGDVAT